MNPETKATLDRLRAAKAARTGVTANLPAWIATTDANTGQPAILSINGGVDALVLSAEEFGYLNA